MARTRGGARGSNWFVRVQSVGTGALGFLAQATVLDVPIEDVLTGQAFGGGTLRSFVLSMTGFNQFIREGPHVIALVVPNGVAIPVLIEHEDRLRAASSWWHQFVLPVSGGDASSQMLSAKVRLPAREFGQGDRIVIVMVNYSGTTWAGGSEVSFILEGEVDED